MMRAGPPRPFHERTSTGATREIVDDRDGVVTTYVGNVTVFDGRTTRSGRGVLIADDGRIAWVGAHARAPRGARAARGVDGAGRTLTPGLIDCHVHLQFDGLADFEAEARAITPTMGALKAASNARRHLERGVTTVRDLGGLDGVSAQVGDAVEAGLLSGARIVAAGRALTVTGGHGHNIALARQVDGPDAMRTAVREEIRAGARAIKVIATGGVLTPGIGATFAAYTPEELGAAVDEAHRWGRGVAAHAIGEEGILNAVRAGVDSVEHCNHVTAEIVREMKARGTFRSPTICAIRGILDHSDVVARYAVEKAAALEEASRNSHGRAVRAGVRHVCGTDAGTPFNAHGNAALELVHMVEWGMTSSAAMRAATANGAELLRLDDVGTVEQGKVADLVLYEGNPADDIAAALRPLTVWKAGVSLAGTAVG
jgi:imidazolonepropionase-like amidohydrolase